MRFKARVTEKYEAWYSQHGRILLPIQQYSQWIDTVLTGSKYAIDQYLSQVDEEEVKLLVNGVFVFTDMTDTCGMKHTLPAAKFDIVSPLTMAVAKASGTAVETLIKHGAKITQQDRFGHNIVHLMACCAFTNPKLEAKWAALFTDLTGFIAKQELKELLFQENVEGMRAVEFACQQGAFLLSSSIWNTEGIYRKQVKPTENEVLTLYDVTDYESHKYGKRQQKSPMNFVVYMDESLLEKPEISAIFSSLFFSLWIKAKTCANIPFIVLWYFFRLLHNLAFVSLNITNVKVDLQKQINATNIMTPCPNFITENISFAISDSVSQNIAIIVGTYSTFILILDITELIWLNVSRDGCRVYRNLSGFKNIVAQDYFYRVAQFGSNVTILIGTYGTLAGSTAGINTGLLHLASPLLMTWSMLYFAQVLPVIGYFVICMQRMLQSMLLFVVTLALAMVPFIQAFTLYVGSKVPEQCVQGFGTFQEAFYTLFTLMLNINNFADVHLQDPIGLWILHTSFVFGVAILMLNFLIAVMSEKVNTVTKNKHTITIIQRMTMCHVLERRFGQLFGRYYEWVKARYFVYENGRVYLANLDQRDYFEY
jgi:hypothetical protein